jgi:hypothetical protein
VLSAPKLLLASSSLIDGLVGGGLLADSSAMECGAKAEQCHTPVLKSRTEASKRVPRMFNYMHSNNMINR